MMNLADHDLPLGHLVTLHDTCETCRKPFWETYMPSFRSTRDDVSSSRRSVVGGGEKTCGGTAVEL